MRPETVLSAIGLSVILLIGCPQVTYPQSATHPPQLIGTWLSISDPDTLGKINWTQYELKSDGSYVYVGGWDKDILVVIRGAWEVAGSRFYERLDLIVPARNIPTPAPGYKQVQTFSTPDMNTLVIGNQTFERVTK